MIRFSRSVAFVSCLTPAMLIAQGVQVDQRVIRDAPSNHQMLLEFRKAELESAKHVEQEITISQDISKLRAAENLLDQTSFLSFSGTMTMVPKGSIIEISEKFADRLQRTVGARVVDFPAFVAANRNWISTYEVTFAQAQGKMPINDDAKVYMKKNGNVVIATFRGNPIEVLSSAQSQEATPKLPSSQQ